ncbi:MAG: hypothetical protein AAGH74_04140 [Pseudomonadota bacterium]
MIKFYYPDGDVCWRALHSVHAVFYSAGGVLTARTDRPDGSYYEFEIKGFELIEAGKVFPEALT